MNKNISVPYTQLLIKYNDELLEAKRAGDKQLATSIGFRIKATSTVISIIDNFKIPITNISQLKSIKGVGKGSLARINEILQTGTLAELGDVISESPYDNLKEVIGIGDATAIKYVEMGIKTVDDLKKAVSSGKVKVSNQISMGLKYHNIVKGAIPRTETNEIKEYLTDALFIVEPRLEFIICGSYRRGKGTSGDIDVLIYHPDMKTVQQVENPRNYSLKPYLKLVLERLITDEFVIDSLSDYNNVTDWKGFCSLDDNPVRRIDITLIPFETYGAAILHATGPFELNTFMRKIAIEHGLKLNEYGLFKGNEIIKTPTEESVFEALNLDYISPEDREGWSTKAKIKAF